MSNTNKQKHAEQMVAKACHWVHKNPEKWSALEQFCAFLTDRGDIIQRGNIYELARHHGMSIKLASEFRRDHNLWSVLARYLVMTNPHMLSAIRFRQTPIDDVNLVKYWRDIVGEDSFAASNLSGAKLIYETSRQ